VTVQVRPATTEDTEAVLRLWDEVVDVRTLQDRAEDVHRLLVRDQEALLVADLDGRVIGTLIAGWDGWRGNMYRLAVSPGSRRLGIAAALVAEAERRLAAKGCRRVTALVVHREEAAPAFWGSAGYEPDPTTARFVKNLGPPK
jgi:ribosomal protein S18 acetylase RimI-like enzyme